MSFVRIGIRAICLLIFGWASPAWASPQHLVREMVRGADLRETVYGMAAIDLSTGETLVSINADEPMIPASNMKLVTAAAALGVLGSDFVFKTELALIRPEDGKKVEGVEGVAGSQRSGGSVLVVRGDGDPAFGDAKVLSEHHLDFDALMQGWVEAVLETGVRRIQRLVVDDRVFDTEFVHPSWPKDQLTMWYCAQVSGLNFNGNCLDVYPEPTRVGQSPRVLMVPSVPFISTTNKAVTDVVDTFWISRKPNTNDLTFWGKVKYQHTQPIHVTIHDPAIVLGGLLAGRLVQAGVEVERVERPGEEEVLPRGKVLYVVQTTLPLVLKRCNKDSQNLFAEALIKRMGREATGSPGGWGNGAAAVRIFLQQVLGARSAAIVVSDGSGLSTENRVTAGVMVDLLRTMYEHPKLGPIYLNSLSVAGSDGTLRKRFKEELGGRVYAKSGYIDGVSCLSGYLILGSEEAEDVAGGVSWGREHTVAFSMLFNNLKPPVYPYKVKQLQEDVVQAICEQLAAAGRRAARVETEPIQER